MRQICFQVHQDIKIKARKKKNKGKIVEKYKNPRGYRIITKVVDAQKHHHRSLRGTGEFLFLLLPLLTLDHAAGTKQDINISIGRYKRIMKIATHRYAFTNRHTSVSAIFQASETALMLTWLGSWLLMASRAFLIRSYSRETPC